MPTLLKPGIALAIAALFCHGAAAQQPAAPDSVVQAQLDAYNERDLERFLSTFSEGAELYVFPAALQAKGRAAIRQRYQPRFADAKPGVQLVNRIVQGNIVIDQERVRVMLPDGPGVIETIVIYEVRGAQIVKATLLPGRTLPGEKL